MPQRFNNIISMLDTAKIEIVSFLIALFVPTLGGLMFIGLLIFADTLTGVWKTVKKHGWKKVQSRILSNGIIPKLTMYPLILLIASGCQQSFPQIPFIKGSVFLLMCIELKSLIENLNVILKINLFTYIKTFVLKGRKGLVEEMFKDDKSNNR